MIGKYLRKLSKFYFFLSYCNHFPQQCLSGSTVEEVTLLLKITNSLVKTEDALESDGYLDSPCTHIKKKKNVRSPVFMVTFTGSRSSRNHYSTTQLLWFILHFNILDDHEKHFRNYGHWNFHRSHWNLEELAVIQPANHGSPHDASSQLAVSKNHQTEALQVSNKITSSVAIFEDLWR